MASRMSDGVRQAEGSEMLFLFSQCLENRAVSPALEMKWQRAWPLLPLLAMTLCPVAFTTCVWNESRSKKREGLGGLPGRGRGGFPIE